MELPRSWPRGLWTNKMVAVFCLGLVWNATIDTTDWNIAACFFVWWTSRKDNGAKHTAANQVISCLFPPRTNYSLTSFYSPLCFFLFLSSQPPKKIIFPKSQTTLERSKKQERKFRNEKKKIVKYIFHDIIFIVLLLNLIITPVCISRTSEIKCAL